MTKIAINVTPASDLRRAFLLTVIYVLTLIVFGRSIPFIVSVFSLLLIPVSVWISIHDLRDFTIPEIGTASIAVLGLCFLVLFAQDVIILYILGSLTAVFIFWLLGEVVFRWRGIDAFGIGDAKLIGACTLWVGIGGLPTLLFFASVGGIIVALIRSGCDKGIAFGPFVAYANFLVWLIGPIYL